MENDDVSLLTYLVLDVLKLRSSSVSIINFKQLNASWDLVDSINETASRSKVTRRYFQGKKLK